MKPRVIAIIPARSGSKRIPGKNIKPLAGKPLLDWTIDYAMSLSRIDYLTLSVDSDELADLGRRKGLEVSRLRPTNLASDTASSLDVVLDELDYQQKLGREFDQVLLLQPTSPFRSTTLWEKALNLKSARSAPAVVGVSPAPAYPEHMYRMSDSLALSPVLNNHHPAKRTQDLPASYVINGSMYLIDISALRQAESFMPSGTVGVLSDTPHLDVDIDTPSDWEMAELLAQHYMVNQ